MRAKKKGAAFAAPGGLEGQEETSLSYADALGPDVRWRTQESAAPAGRFRILRKRMVNQSPPWCSAGASAVACPVGCVLRDGSVDGADDRPGPRTGVG